MYEKVNDNLKKMSFTEHLLELRKRILICLCCFVVCLVVLSPFMNELFLFISDPLIKALPQGTQLLAVGVIAPVMGPLKVLLFTSFFFSLPFIVYELWLYLAPALYRREKKFVFPLVISSFVMFLLGIVYCYFFVFGLLFRFISSFAPNTISFAPDIDSYLSFVLHMFFSFGIAFEVPVAVVVLRALGVLNQEKMKRFRRYVIVGAFALSAIITPPDIGSQLMLALPIIILYEVGLLISGIFFSDSLVSQEDN